jgi:hypothetical protein
LTLKRKSFAPAQGGLAVESVIAKAIREPAAIAAQATITLPWRRDQVDDAPNA